MRCHCEPALREAISGEVKRKLKFPSVFAFGYAVTGRVTHEIASLKGQLAMMLFCHVKR